MYLKLPCTVTSMNMWMIATFVILFAQKCLKYTENNCMCSAYHWLINLGTENNAKLLIDNGAIVDAKQNDGYAPLHMTAAYGKLSDIFEPLFNLQYSVLQ